MPHQKLAPLVILVTHSRARMERAGLQGVRWPHRRRANFPFLPFRWRGGGDRAQHRRSAARRVGEKGAASRAPGSRRKETGVLAPLALGMGSCAAGDAAPEIGPVSHPRYPLARADGACRAAGCEMAPPAPRQFSLFTFSLAGWRRSSAASKIGSASGGGKGGGFEGTRFAKKRDGGTSSARARYG